MKRKSIIFWVCFFVLFSLNKRVYADPENTDFLELYSESAILIDADTKQILYSKNEHQILYPASITKIMTILLGLENGNLEDTVTMSHDAVYSIPSDSSHIALFENEQISLADALYAASIASANDACNGIAEYVSGNMEKFAKLMTTKAKQIGALNTNFANPHGLTDENHYTTAYDMALIMAYAVNVENYIDITSTLHYNVNPTNIQSEIRYLHNSNKTMDSTSKYYVKEAITSKTGWTPDSQSTQVTYASKNGLNLIAVVIKAKSSDLRYEDTKKLFEYGFANYEYFAAGTMQLMVPTVLLSEELTLEYEDKEMLRVDATFTDFVIEAGTSDQIKIVYEVPEVIDKEYGTNSSVGKINLYYGEKLVQSIDVLTIQSIVQKSSISSNSTTNKLLMIGFVGTLLTLIILFILKNYYLYKLHKKAELKELRYREIQMRINQRIYY